MDYDTSFKIGRRVISNESPTYFIADIGANHDGELSRAKRLIELAKESGADCAKFQHFQAASIVSRHGFEGLNIAHQRGWDKSVYEVYEQYSIHYEWNIKLRDACFNAGIDFMTTPYDLDAVDAIDPMVKAFKIGSGDITYEKIVRYIAASRKPTFLATGASSMAEVEAAVGWFLEHNRQLCLMQCNTNYTGNMENMAYVNLNVLRSFAHRWPSLPLGLSDHTGGHVAVLGSVALGARVIEKHFTDDKTRLGPDHCFALEPGEWLGMVRQTRFLESAMGDGFKICEDNEVESRVVQRRAIRLKRDLVAGDVISAEDIEFLRPCPEGAFTPAQVNLVLGYPVQRFLHAGEAITWADI
jgi:N-acetylneuraminate synthase